jgi:hypothetical protein
MTDLESNIQAYRTMAEVLINLRKIIVRGLEKVAGETWYRDGCPPGLYQRLVERKESELAIQRFSTEYEDLISFATFEDLAEIVESNRDLARLLRNLAPSTELLCARLLELEALRAKLAQGRELNVEEITVITNYSTNLVATLAGARRRMIPSREAAAPATGPAPTEVAESPPETVAVPDDEEADELTIRAESGERLAAAAVAPDGGAEGAVDGAVSAGGREPRSEKPAPVIVVQSEPPTAAVLENREALDVVQPAAVVESTVAEDGQQAPDESGAPATAPLTEFDAIATEMEKALAEGDERDVLRVLRREVIAVAEAVYRLDEGVQPPGWELVLKNGWFEAHKEQFGLVPLAEFHGLVEEYQVGQAEGLDPDELRGMLSSRRFSRLLLTLREMFLRNAV